MVLPTPVLTSRILVAAEMRILHPIMFVAGPPLGFMFFRDDWLIMQCGIVEPTLQIHTAADSSLSQSTQLPDICRPLTLRLWIIT